MKYISNNIIETVKEIAAKYPKTVFCGSFGLVLNGLLHREVIDLDVITEINYYGEGGFFDDNRIHPKSNSHTFMINDDKVECFNIELYKVKVDVLFSHNTKPDYNVMKFDNVFIKVEKPISAIIAKLGYLKNDRSIKSFIKHLKDLLYMGVTNKDILIALDDCKILDNNEEYMLPNFLD